MSSSLKSFLVSFFFLMLFFLPANFNQVSAVCGCWGGNRDNYEQTAWGGNGGWWGLSNRDWYGDRDEWPGYQNHNGYGYSRCYHCCGCHHNYAYHNHMDYCAPRYEYYYDDSVPGAGLYFNLR
jgi:hypothetical protein